MAFDMYAGDRHEAIYSQDEYIFDYVSLESEVFPKLNALYSKFYSEFKISPEHAGLLVHELLALQERFGVTGGKALGLLVMRLALFFSFAVRSNIVIQCVGD